MTVHCTSVADRSSEIRKLVPQAICLSQGSPESHPRPRRGCLVNRNKTRFYEIVTPQEVYTRSMQRTFSALPHTERDKKKKKMHSYCLDVDFVSFLR